MLHRVRRLAWTGLHVRVLHRVLWVHGTHGHGRARARNRVCYGSRRRTEGHSAATALDGICYVQGLELVECRRGIVRRGRGNGIDLKIWRRRSLLCKVWHRTILLGVEGSCKGAQDGVSECESAKSARTKTGTHTCIWRAKVVGAGRVVSELDVVLRIVRERALPEVALRGVLSLG